MITVAYDMTGFHAGMAGLIKATGATMRTVIEKETGELVKALVQKSAPKSLKKSSDALKKSMRVRFDVTTAKPGRNEQFSPSGDVKWTFSNEKFLYGIKPDLDLRRASAGDVAAKFLTSRTRKNGASRWLFPFKHPRSTQKVSIAQRVTVLEKTANAAAKLLAQRFGKLKASWLAAVKSSPIRLTGGKFPQWVLHHVPTAKGSNVNGLQTPDAPFFEIISRAHGVGSRPMSLAIKSALAYRAAAMKTNARLFASGKKHLGDYANGQAVKL